MVTVHRVSINQTAVASILIRWFDFFERVTIIYMMIISRVWVRISVVSWHLLHKIWEVVLSVLPARLRIDDTQAYIRMDCKRGNLLSRWQWQWPLENNYCSPHLEVAFRPCVSGDLHKKKFKKNTWMSNDKHRNSNIHNSLYKSQWFTEICTAKINVALSILDIEHSSRFVNVAISILEIAHSSRFVNVAISILDIAHSSRFVNVAISILEVAHSSRFVPINCTSIVDTAQTYVNVKMPNFKVALRPSPTAAITRTITITTPRERIFCVFCVEQFNQ